MLPRIPLRAAVAAALLAVVVALVVMAVLPPAPPALAQTKISVQEAMLRASPGVALVVAEAQAEVTLNCGSGPTTVTPPPFRETGTGWFLASDGWLITNGHVVQPAHDPPPWLVNQQAQRAVTSACLPAALERAGLTPGERPDREEAIKRRLLDSVLPTAKVKLVRKVTVKISSGIALQAQVKKYTPPVSNQPGAMSGRDLALIKVEGDNYPVLPLAEARSARVGDPIHILGFPGVVLSHELLNQAVAREASVTQGAISGFQEDVAKQPVIQTDAPAAWGNSGGPAVNDHGEVVGVLTFVSLAPGAEGSIVQGFNFVIPADAVRTFIQGTPVDLSRRSRFNDTWWSGLRALFTEDWRTADRRIREADQFQPGLREVKRVLDDVQDKIKNPPPRPFPWFWVAIAVTALSAGGYGAQFAVRWQKNRYRIAPSEVIRLMESGKNPMILDVRAKQAYETLPFKIPGSVRLPPEDLAGSLTGMELDQTRHVVAYCTAQDEAVSARAAKELRGLGFKEVYILKGGLGAWTNSGLPIETRSDISAVGVEIYKALASGNV